MEQIELTAQNEQKPAELGVPLDRLVIQGCMYNVLCKGGLFGSG